MIVSHKYKFVFVHIPKTAGTSIMEALRPKLCSRTDFIHGDIRKHLTAHAIRQQFFADTGVWWRNYFPFAVIRNPWEMLHSDWWFCNNYTPGPSADSQFKAKVDRVRQCGGFEEFVRKEVIPNAPKSLWQYFCCAPGGAELVRYTLRYEMLAEDWRRVIRLIGLPGIKLPQTNNYNRPDYRLDYNDALAEAVGNCYADDICRFGYRFDAV